MFIRRICVWGLIAFGTMTGPNAWGQSSYQVLPGMSEPAEMVFIKQAAFEPSSDYDFQVTTLFRANSGDAACEVAGEVLYDEVAVAGWQEETGFGVEFSAAAYDVQSSLTIVPIFGPSTVITKTIALPNVLLGAQGVAPGDSETFADTNLEVRLLESFVWHSFEVQAETATLLIWNEQTDSWDSVDSIDLSSPQDFDFGIFGFDTDLDLATDEAWFLSLGNNKYGLTYKVTLLFEDDSTASLEKTLELWSLPSGPGGGGPGGQP